jgi:CheY-like chemotaxis protein
MRLEKSDRPSILLVEDDIVNKKVAKGMLKHLGFQPGLAANGLEAIQALEDQRYDIILMDIQMPKMNGLEATKAIRARFPPDEQPHIIAVTAYAMTYDREKCISAGMDDYLSKPITLDDLKEIISRYSRHE